ncbi:MAG: glutamine synthetase, partial [Pseudomonadales bacterium]
MSKTMQLIEEHNAKWLDMRFTDSKGKEHHVTVPVSDMGDEFFEEGKMF